MLPLIRLTLMPLYEILFYYLCFFFFFFFYIIGLESSIVWICLCLASAYVIACSYAHQRDWVGMIQEVINGHFRKPYYQIPGTGYH